jgi:hypothetical protein
MRALAWFGKFCTAPLTLLLVFYIAYFVGFDAGFKSGEREGVDNVMCVMDRIAHDGQRGNSGYCKRVDAILDARK